MTQRQLADAVGVSRSTVAMIEAGLSNTTVGMIDRIARVLGLEIDLVVRQPILVGGPAERDALHAWCSGYVDRRLRRHGFETAREVEIVHAQSHGWIDLLAFDARTRALLVVEVKTRLEDVGAVERQVGWYERSAFEAARRIGWRPVRAASLIVLLATAETDAMIHRQRRVLAVAFPVRAAQAMAWLDEPSLRFPGRGIALIDPSSRRTRWLMPSRLDGRRSPSPYVDNADAARYLARGG